MHCGKLLQQEMPCAGRLAPEQEESDAGSGVTKKISEAPLKPKLIFLVLFLPLAAVPDARSGPAG